MSAGVRSPLGAFFLAIGKLHPDAETAAQIAALLRLSEEEREAAPPGEIVEPEVPPAAPPAVEPAMPAAVVTADAAPKDAGPLGAGGARAFRVQRIAGPSPPSLDALPALPQAPPARARELPFEPLLRPVATRAIVLCAVRRRAPVGAVDAERLAQIIARRQVVARPPRLSAWVTARTRVLIDRGPGMAPFARDATDLAERIGMVASKERTEVLRFWQSPRRVGASQRAGAKVAPPPPGTAVIALTDLGIAPAGAAIRGLQEDWLDFSAEIRDAGSSLVVFVPYPAERWPVALAEGLTLVSWDRTTSLGAVRAAIRAQGGAS